jgi:hypothetical protein
VHHARLRVSGEEVAVKVRHPQVCNETFVDINVGPACPHHPVAPAHLQPRAARLPGRLISGRS